MEFLCPHCQNKLMVQDQYAGTLMKCPYCSKTFQAPAQAPAMPPVPPPPPVSPPPPVTPGRGLNSDPLAAPAKSAPPPPPPPGMTPVSKEAPAQQPLTPPATSTEYQQRHTVTLSPKVVPWVAVGAWGLVFVLFWFPWVGLYPDGIGVYTQGPVGSAWGGEASPDIKDWGTYVTKFSSVDNKQTVSDFLLKKDAKEPSLGELKGNVFMGLFVFFLFWLAFLVVVAAAVWPLVQIRLPPAVEQLRPWRWALAAGLSLAALFFLVMQLIVGFSLEHTVTERADTEVKKLFKSEGEQIQHLALAERVAAVNPQRTFALRLAFWLSLLATIAAALQFWLDYRGQRPLPQLELRW
jgi:hypothetical protein